MMMIAILLDAGKDSTGKQRKISVMIDHMGQQQETRVGWPDSKEVGIHFGPVFKITPEEYALQCRIACAEA